MKNKKLLTGTAIAILLGGIYFGANYLMEKYLKGNKDILQEQPSSTTNYLMEKYLKGNKDILQEQPSSTITILESNDVKPNVPEPTPSYKIEPLSLKGKSLDDYFKEFEELDTNQQKNLTKKLDDLTPWDFILLSRYIPIDGILRNLSSFYSTDYKTYLKTLLSESILNPLAVGPTQDKGLGQLTPSPEEWARNLYDKKLEYHFPGKEISDKVFDPYSNLVLSSIIFRKAAEEKVSDFDSLYSLYTNGFEGVTLNKEGFYETNKFGLNDTTRANNFNDIADKLIILSWLSMDRPDLKENLKNEELKKVIERNNSEYDEKEAYEGMIDLLEALSKDKKNSDEDRKMFDSEINNISNLIGTLYS